MVFVRGPRRNFDINIRHSVALTGSMKQEKKKLFQLVMTTMLLRTQQIVAGNLAAARTSNRFIQFLMNSYLAVSIVPVALPVNFAGPRFRLDNIDPSTIGACYRFNNLDQLREVYLRLGLYAGSRNGYYIIKANKIHAEEAMLIVFEKCALGLRHFELQNKYHIAHNVISQIIEWFCDWIQQNWIYLIRQNTAYFAAPVGPGQLSQMELSANKFRDILITVSLIFFMYLKL